MSQAYRVLLVGQVTKSVIRKVERGYPSRELGVVLQAPAWGPFNMDRVTIPQCILLWKVSIPLGVITRKLGDLNLPSPRPRIGCREGKRQQSRIGNVSAIQFDIDWKRRSFLYVFVCMYFPRSRSHSLCWPVLSPQMEGAIFREAPFEMMSSSAEQRLKPPSLARGGPRMLSVSKSNRRTQISEEGQEGGWRNRKSFWNRIRVARSRHANKLTGRGLSQQKGARVIGGVGTRILGIRDIGAIPVDGIAARGLVESAAYSETEMKMRCAGFDLTC